MTITPTPGDDQPNQLHNRAEHAEALLEQTTAALAVALHWARTTDDPKSAQELGGCLYALKDAAAATGRDVDPVDDYPHLEAA